MLAQESIAYVQQIADALPTACLARQQQVFGILQDGDLLLAFVLARLLEPKADKARAGQRFKLREGQVVKNEAVEQLGHERAQIAGLAAAGRAEQHAHAALTLGQAFQPACFPGDKIIAIV